VDSPYTPGTAPRSVQAVAPRPVGEILSHAAGQYEIDKATVVQHLSVLRRAGVIHGSRVGRAVVTVLGPKHTLQRAAGSQVFDW
jgi:DNA-binding transcriptional ArsR family regulator